MRWKIILSYVGTSYCGWQRQPGSISVQQKLEEAFSTILRQPVSIAGCGRTDTGVHARYYVAHADIEGVDPSDKLTYQINAILPDDIAIHSLSVTDASFHARFDAFERHYRYYLHFSKDPFSTGRSFWFQGSSILNQEAMQNAAAVLLQFDRFQPLCKTGSDAEHFRCSVTESSWHFESDSAVYSIKANRFLRGMVRLIVGACLNAGTGKITPEEIRECLVQQSPLPYAWSVPPEGLYLEGVRYA